MIISKAKGQSLKEKGIFLREECFSHMLHAQKLDLQKAYKNWHPQGKRNKCSL
jgi:hypothetical protein